MTVLTVLTMANSSKLVQTSHCGGENYPKSCGTGFDIRE